MDNTQKTMDMIVNLAKGRGFVYPGSEIYGGLANAWDYGPLGVEFKNKIRIERRHGNFVRFSIPCGCHFVSDVETFLELINAK